MILVSQELKHVCTRGKICVGGWDGFYLYADGSVDCGGFAVKQRFRQKHEDGTTEDFYGWTEDPAQIKKELLK